MYKRKVNALIFTRLFIVASLLVRRARGCQKGINQSRYCPMQIFLTCFLLLSLTRGKKLRGGLFEQFLFFYINVCVCLRRSFRIKTWNASRPFSWIFRVLSDPGKNVIFFSFKMQKKEGFSASKGYCCLSCNVFIYDWMIRFVN